jgi:hypothetical protein
MSEIEEELLRSKRVMDKNECPCGREIMGCFECGELTGCCACEDVLPYISSMSHEIVDDKICEVDQRRCLVCDIANETEGCPIHVICKMLKTAIRHGKYKEEENLTYLEYIKKHNLLDE